LKENSMSINSDAYKERAELMSKVQKPFIICQFTLIRYEPFKKKRKYEKEEILMSEFN
jgi:hypothetical protein